MPAGSVSYTYYANGLRQTMSPSPTNQTALTYCYDSINRLTLILSSGTCSSPGTSQAKYGYDADRRLGNVTLPNGVFAAYGYNSASDLTGITYTNGSNILGSLTYTYDATGKRLSMGGSLGLTGLPTAVSSVSYNADDQLTSWGSTSYSYDHNGNMTSDGTHTFVWDQLNRLIQIQTGSLIKTQTYAFAYEPFGRRASKTVGSQLSSTVTNYLYDGYDKVQEVVGGTATAGYLSGPGVDSNLSRTSGGLTSSYMDDALGSKMALTDSTGSVQTAYQYEPYGEVTTGGAASSNDVQYTGRENDGSGLYYYRARYYSSVLKRFISEDPIGFMGGVNPYAYAEGNPLMFIDPFGFAAYTAEQCAQLLEFINNQQQLAHVYARQAITGTIDPTHQVRTLANSPSDCDKAFPDPGRREACRAHEQSHIDNQDYWAALHILSKDFIRERALHERDATDVGIQKAQELYDCNCK
jgi:RHS repeat-associated protein